MSRRTWNGLKVAVAVVLGAPLAFAGVDGAVIWGFTHHVSRTEETFSARDFAKPSPEVLTTTDGLHLGAWLWEGAAGEPCIVLLHGYRGSRSSEKGLLKLLASDGACVLAPSLRAHGDSEGALNDFGWSAQNDVEAAVAFVEKRFPGRDVYVFGRSLGAAASIFAAGRLSTRVRGYILESPYQDLRTAVENRMDVYLPAPLAPWAGRLTWALGIPLTGIPGQSIRPIDYIHNIPETTPVLLLAGDADRLATLAEERALYEVIRGHARLEVFPGAEHFGLRASDAGRYDGLLRDFMGLKRPRQVDQTH